jgi:beta-glucanase (GH16 family)
LAAAMAVTGLTAAGSARGAEPADIPACSSVAATDIQPRAWTQVAGDEFNGTSVDQTKWGLYSGSGTGGIGTRSPSAISEADGELRITGTGTDPTGATDVSGGMAHQQRPITYGRWEVRMKADEGNGYGQALLLWPDSEKWPQDGELDFVELPHGDRARAFFTIHYGSSNSQDHCYVDGDFSGWHTYMVEWEPDHVSFYLDGSVVYTVTDPAAIPTKPMHLAIQQDMGPFDNWIDAPDENTPDNVVMHVDWARVYQSTD